MTEILAVFRSRSQAIDALQKLKNKGIPAVLINTPKEAGVGCGLSVKFTANALSKAKNMILRGGYSAFYAFYTLDNTYGRNFIKRLK